MATIQDVAAALGCKVDGAKARLAALGYVETCGRCGGSGRYSYNQIDGDRCYGCNGSGKRLAAITAKLVAEAKARQDAGELADYFARNRAHAEARKLIAPLVTEAHAVYRTISDAYSRAGKAGGRVNESLCNAQDLNNALYWGPAKDGRMAGDLFFSDSVSDVEWRASHGRENALSAVVKLRERIAELTALRDSAAPHLEAWIAGPGRSDSAKTVDAS